MSIDPVCNMKVDVKEDTASTEYDGEKYYFCSRSCLKVFEENPGKYLTHSEKQEGEKKAENVFKDPVCGMTTEEENAFALYEHEGESYYFCSDHCLTKFKNEPGSFIDSRDEVKPQEEEEPGGVRKYTCPMHPEVEQDGPGTCPKCGMALEPLTISLEEEEDPEYGYMKKRFIIGAVLTIPLVFIAMRDILPGGHIIGNLTKVRTLGWLELILATPVVVWAGWPFFVRAVQSLINKSLNMFTLIGMGVSVAYVYSLIAILFPQIFPEAMRGADGSVGVYFEASAVIVTLILLGQVME
ncbi:MAG: YHS domain-containing protein, partial [Planctomycetota bacterium]